MQPWERLDTAPKAFPRGPEAATTLREGLPLAKAFGVRSAMHLRIAFDGRASTGLRKKLVFISAYSWLLFLEWEFQPRARASAFA